jgi:hypothetical protein
VERTARALPFWSQGWRIKLGSEIDCAQEKGRETHCFQPVQNKYVQRS